MSTYLEVPGQKFWRIEVIGSSCETKYGKIGANGQKQLKQFSDDAAAAAFADKQVKAKVKKGYSPAIDPNGPGGGGGGAAAPKGKAAPKKTAVKKAPPKRKAAAAPAAKATKKAAVAPAAAKAKPKAVAAAAGGGGGAEVDEHAPANLRSSGSHVVGEYSCMLNQVNLVAANNNKFYKLQLIEASDGCYQYVRYGRVGETGAQQVKGPWSEDEAVKSFMKQFKAKTANAWDTRLTDFTKKDKKYDLVAQSIKTTAQVSAAAAAMVAAGGTAAVKVDKSKLDTTTLDLMSLIFDEDVALQAMKAMNIDPEKLPLGALSRTQIDRGYVALKELKTAVDSSSDHAIGVATGKFYTIIPHSFGRSKPPLIRTKAEVDEKVEMLNTLAQIEDAMSMRTSARRRSTKGKGKVVTVPHPSDQHYDELEADLTLLKKGSKNFKMIKKYLDSTDPAASSAGFCSWGGSAMKLEDVWSCDRNGEDDRFAEYDALDNRKLLWHGTNVAVVAAILKSGLRIMPHSGGRVGAGIYLADQHAKSAGYCRAARAPDGRTSIIMFLVEAALGNEHTILQDDWTLKKPPAGFDSVVARGTVEPDPFKDATMKIDGKDVKVPQSKEVKTGRSSSFHHNEFLVYNEAQHRIRFVLRFVQ